MINLIPNKEKKAIVVGSYYRLTVLLFIVIGFSFFIFFIVLLPAFFSSSVKINIINEKLAIQKDETVPVPDQETLAVIKDLNKKLDLVEGADKNKFIVSEQVINAIIVKKIPKIKITQIAYDNSPSVGGKGGKKISIQGNAPSREVLLQFRHALEDSASFKQVDLPISNFVKGSNIQFYLSLIPA